MFNPLFLCSVFRCVTVSDIPQQHISYFFQSIATHRRCRHSINIFRFYRLKYLYYCSSCCVVALCSCQVRNKKKLIFFINGEPLARFPMLLLYNFVFSLLLLIIPSSSLKVIKVPSDFNMLVIIHQHISNEISDYFFIKLIQLTKLC